MSETPRRIKIERKDISALSTPISTPRRLATASSAVKAAHFAGIDVRSPVVIEIGSRWTKYGIGGEYVPRKIVSSFIKNPTNEKVVHVLDHSLPHDELYKVLNVFFKKIIVKDLLNPAQERRIVIVESLFTPSEIRRLIAEVLFEEHTYKVPSIIYVPAPLMNLFPFGTKSSLVIDIGYHSTTVFPVFDFVVVFNAYEENGAGGGTMSERISEYLLTKGKIRDHDGSLRDFNEDEKQEFERRKVAEDINSRFFMVTQMERAKIIHDIEDKIEPETPLQFAPDIEIPFGTRKIVIPGYLREAAAECFFEKEESCGSAPIPELIMRSLIKTPIDIRRLLLNNILVTGSAAGLPGMLGRIKVELKELLKSQFPKLIDEVMFIKVPQDNRIERYSSWLGGSFFADMDELIHRVYTKDDWTNKKPLPDWTNYIDDYKIPHVPDMIVSQNIKDIIHVTPKLNESVA
uniref:Actin-related protein 10 n=1 Tax=Panagrolaimus superbus TaxID=310955 RepID=A0A914Y2T4_9BILA